MPCGFDDANPSHVARFEKISGMAANAIAGTEPYKPNGDKFAVYRVDDYRGKTINHANYGCWYNSLLVDAAVTCGFEQTPGPAKSNPPGNQKDQIIALSPSGGSNGGNFVDGNGYFSILGADDASNDAYVPYATMHETGHTIGNFAHTCYGGPNTANHYVNCGETKISDDQPCQEWNSGEYSNWVRAGDPAFGCYSWCGDADNRYKPWNTDTSIMCFGSLLKYTPVERKFLYDVLTS